MNRTDIAVHRLHQQGLSNPRFTSAAEVVAWHGAVQAQDYPGGKWAVAQRAPGFNNAALDEAFARGEMLRTHVLRPTWHFVVPQDLRWMLTLTAPRINTAMGTYYRQNELDDALFTRCNDLMAKALMGGNQLTKPELTQVLAANGIVMDMMRLGFVLLRAELDLVVVSGAWEGKQQTFALFDERVPATPQPTRDEALAMLALRYFTSHGPATLKDYQWWSGLTMKDARTGLEMVKGELLEATMEDDTYWFAEAPVPPRSETPTLYLLPNYDEYLVAYVDRTAAYNPNPRSPADKLENILFAHTLVLDGEVIGTWKATVKKQRLLLTPIFFRPLTLTEQSAYGRAVARYAEFLGVEVAEN